MRFREHVCCVQGLSSTHHESQPEEPGLGLPRPEKGESGWWNLGAHLLVDFTTQALSACFLCFLRLAPGTSKFTTVLVQAVRWSTGARSRPSPGLLFCPFPGDSEGKESACNVGDSDSIPGWERSPGEGNPLQNSCLENSTDRGAWQAAVHGVTELDTTEQLALFTLLAGVLQPEPRAGVDSDPCPSPPMSSLLRFSLHPLPLRSPVPLSALNASSDHAAPMLWFLSVTLQVSILQITSFLINRFTLVLHFFISPSLLASPPPAP